MSTISIIGTGNMATALGTRAARHGHAVEVLSRDPAKAQALADQLGDGAFVGTYGAAPAGDLVILAVPYTVAVDVVHAYGDALAGKTLVDISNTFNAEATGLRTAPGASAGQEIAAAAPTSTDVVKALNTVFGHVLVEDRRLDTFIAGDDAGAKARVASFLESVNVRSFDVGALAMAQVLEWTAILLMGLAQNGAGWNVALGADLA